MASNGKTLRLGLIGGNILATRSPSLHIVCGLSVGLNTTYDLLVPAEFGLGFADMVAHCRRSGFDGVNVTYPHKEEAVLAGEAGDPAVAAMGSSNTLRLRDGATQAFNTDHSGFVAAYRARWGEASPGRVLVIGTGGVGRAVVFGLATLGASEVLLYDTDPVKAAALQSAVSAYHGVPVRQIDETMLRDLAGIDGVINCTPLGMIGRAGSPLPAGVRGGPRWAFDAVYTPEHTVFRGQVEALGADFLSGYELYFHQGIHAFEIFSGRRVEDQAWVRQVLNHKG